MDSSILWIEKYQPKSLDTLEFNCDIGLRLKELVDSEDFPHMLFYGSMGAGKRTMIRCLLHELYGNKVDKMKGEVREFEKSKSSKVECTVISSPCHIEVTPAEAGNNDKVVVQRLIKEVAGSHMVTQIEGRGKFKVVVINEVDRLGKEAQAGLRRTMEKYMGNCRILMNCQCISKVIEPLRSRVLMIRIPAPTTDEMDRMCRKILTHESATVAKERVREICLKAKRDMRRSIMMLQTAVLGDEKGAVPIPQYEAFTQQIADEILRDQTPRQLKEIREKFNELLVKLVPPREIFWILLNALLGKTPKELHQEIVGNAAVYDHRAQIGSKAIMHLEAFAAKTMAIIKRGKK